MTEGWIAMQDGVQLSFQKVGSASNFLLVPNGIYLFEDFRVLAGEGTVIFYDVRNRGRSDTVSDPVKLARGIWQDVDDLDEVRRHFGADQVDLIGHSYMGLMVALYAMKFAPHAGRAVQIGPAQPDAAKQYSPDLMFADQVLAEVMAELGHMAKEQAARGPREVSEEDCKRFSLVLRRICVVHDADVERIDWGRCELANERNFMRYWVGQIFPSIRSLKLTAEDFAKAAAPVLVVHGRKDRNAPYGGGRDWAMQLPNVRLVTVENAAHAPWVEAPELVFGSIQTFLNGVWPPGAEAFPRV
jgi:proline iminopeptidase